MLSGRRVGLDGREVRRSHVADDLVQSVDCVVAELARVGAEGLLARRLMEPGPGDEPLGAYVHVVVLPLDRRQFVLRDRVRTPAESRHLILLDVEGANDQETRGEASLAAARPRGEGPNFAVGAVTIIRAVAAPRGRSRPVAGGCRARKARSRQGPGCPR